MVARDWPSTRTHPEKDRRPVRYQGLAKRAPKNLHNLTLEIAARTRRSWCPQDHRAVDSRLEPPSSHPLSSSCLIRHEEGEAPFETRLQHLQTQRHAGYTLLRLNLSLRRGEVEKSEVGQISSLELSAAKSSAKAGIGSLSPRTASSKMSSRISTNSTPPTGMLRKPTSKDTLFGGVKTRALQRGGAGDGNKPI